MIANDVTKAVEWVLNQAPSTIVLFFTLFALYFLFRSVNLHDLITHYYPKKHVKMDHDIELYKKSTDLFDENESKIIKEYIHDNVFELITGFMPSKKVYSKFIAIHPILRKSGVSKRRIKTVLQHTRLNDGELTIYRGRTYYLDYYGQIVYMMFVALVLLLLIVYIFLSPEKREYGLLLTSILLFPLVQISSLVSKDKMLNKVSALYSGEQV